MIDAVKAALEALRRDHYPRPDYWFEFSSANLNDGFRIPMRSVVIDNGTARWLYVPSAGRFVPPYTWGAILELAATTQAQIRFLAPGGYTQGATIAGESVIAKFFSEPAEIVIRPGISSTPTTPLPAGAATEATLLTRLQAADTLTGVTTVAAVTAITNALPVGSNVIGGVNQVTGQGRTLLFVPIAQAVAGTTQLVAAQGGALKIKVVSYAFTLSIAGTVKFTGAADLTGAFDLAANGGVAAIGQPSAHLFETAANAALSIVSTLGAAKGHIGYFVEA